MRKFLFCAFAGLTFTLFALGQSSDACEAKIVHYDEFKGEKQYELHLKSPNGALVYLGAEHSRDPKHPQFARIDQEWSKLKPTVAFYEGPNRPIPNEREQVIQQTGESGYVRFLATRDGAKIARLEPDPKAEFEYVREKFPQDQVELFYFLRQAAQFRERQNMNEPQITETITQMLQKAAQMGLPTRMKTTDDLQQAYAKNFNSPQNWWEAPLNWFTPKPEDAEKHGGKFFHAINQRSSEFRDIHMYRVVSQAVKNGERVFAVVGRDHVPMQAPALQCAIGASSK